jgi:hypothetical protein
LTNVKHVDIIRQVKVSGMNTDSFDTFLSLAETLTAQGWAIVKFEDRGGGITLTIAPRDTTNLTRVPKPQETAVEENSERA